MKKLLFLIYLLPNLGFSQNYIPSKDVYDFDIGDEFHYHHIIRDWGVTTNNGYYLNKVINKSIIGNQVTYTFSSKGYHLTAYTYTYTSFNTTFNKTYSINDTIRDTIPPCIDTNHPFIDLSFYPKIICSFLDTLYLDTTFNELNYEKTTVLFEYFRRTNYVKGLGMVYDDDNSIATPPVQFIRKLIYYKKDSSGLSWGTPLPADVGINELGSIDFSIYPNPSTSKINILFNGNISKFNAEIINSLGQVIKNERMKTNSMDVSFIPNGVYFLKITNKDGVFGLKRVIISR